MTTDPHAFGFWFLQVSRNPQKVPYVRARVSGVCQISGTYRKPETFQAGAWLDRGDGTGLLP